MLAGGGSGPVRFTLSAGELPSGLTLAADGTIEGTPVQVGRHRIWILASDASTPPLTDRQLFELEIDDDGGIRIRGERDLQVMLQEPFMFEFIAEDTVAPVEWRIAGGFLPRGVTITRVGAEMLLTGAAGDEGGADLLLEAIDGAGRAGRKAVHLEITSEAGPAIEEGGCTALAGSDRASLLLLLALACTVRYIRRSRWRRSPTSRSAPSSAPGGSRAAG